ncbi:MAG: GntR family transcriptional regulator [Pseudomonadota bacterium]
MIVVAQAAQQAPPARSHAERAYGMLVDRITRLELAPGSMLLDRELTKELGVGRTPIREALHRLVAEGLVVHFPHRGMAVAEITASGTRDIYEFRGLVDGEAARLTANRASEEQVARLRSLADELAGHATGGDVSAYVELDRAFYQLLGEACGNLHIADTLLRIFNLHLRLWFYIAKMKGDWHAMAQAHSTMALETSEAIARRDGSAAEIAIRAYVQQRQKDMRMLM